ncbi:histone H1 [Sphingobacterium kyonggiense]
METAAGSFHTTKKNNIMENFQKVKELVASIESDAEKFYNRANNAAGTRLRKGLQELKVLATEIRKDVTERKNSK